MLFFVLTVQKISVHNRKTTINHFFNIFFDMGLVWIRNIVIVTQTLYAIRKDILVFMMYMSCCSSTMLTCLSQDRK